MGETASPGPRKTALFIINSLAGGGAERVMTTVLGASAPWADRYDIKLVLLDQEASAYAQPEWVERMELDCRGGLLPSLMRVRRLIRRLRPDATISFLTRSNVANVMAGANGACIISERVNASAHFSGGGAARISKAMVRLAYPRADHVIAVSGGVAEDLIGNFAVKRQRISVVANPVDHERIARLADEPSPLALEGDYIVAAGRFVPNKNFAMLIDAFGRSGLPGSLVILGEGPLRQELEAYVQKLGLGGRVLLPGFIQNPFAILKRARLFALSSNAEGFPNGMVEAMACGLPIVAANCASGPSEILLGCPREQVEGIVHGPAGAVVPPNDPFAFAEAMRTVIEPGLRTARGAAARELSRRFSVERTAQQYWEIIEESVRMREADRSPAARARRSARKTMKMGEGVF